jgi:hypothetical protein
MRFEDIREELEHGQDEELLSSENIPSILL